MNFNLKNFTGCELDGVYLFFIICMYGVFFLLFASPGFYDFGYSQKDQTSSTSNYTLLASEQSNIPEFINESYANPSAGFHIVLPGGWKGVNYQNILMVSPAGVHLMNGNLGPNGDKVLMVIQVLNVSDFLDERKAYGEIQEGDCTVLSSKYVIINKIDAQEVFLKCGPNNDNNIVNYFFTSRNKVIVVGLKGSSSVFESNLDKFRKSVSTINIDKPTDIEEIG
jgi:hypothetical protein